MHLYKKNQVVGIMFSFLNRVAGEDGQFDRPTNFSCSLNDLFKLDGCALAINVTITKINLTIIV